MEILSGQPGPDADLIETDPEDELPTHARNLIEARNHLVLTSQAARDWALENPRHPASYLLTRNDVGEQTKIQALRRIESVSMPTEVRNLIEAARFFNDCQAESQAAFDAEFPTTGEHPIFDGEAENETVEGLHAAYLNLLRGYRNWGGFKFHGWTGSKDEESYLGPMIWSDGDCAFRFARALEREFPDRVRLDLKVSKASTSSYDPALDRKHTVDVAIAPAGLASHELSRSQFRDLRHELFVEARWLRKGRWRDVQRQVERCAAIQRDLDGLQASLDRGRCAQAAMLIVDDEGFLDFHGDLLDWPEAVIPLVVSPWAVHDEGLGNGSMELALIEIENLHGRNCPCAAGPLTRSANLD